MFYKVYGVHLRRQTKIARQVYAQTHHRVDCGTFYLVSSTCVLPLRSLAHKIDMPGCTCGCQFQRHMNCSSCDGQEPFFMLFAMARRRWPREHPCNQTCTIPTRELVFVVVRYGKLILEHNVCMCVSSTCSANLPPIPPVDCRPAVRTTFLTRRVSPSRLSLSPSHHNGVCAQRWCCSPWHKASTTPTST